MTNRKVFVKQRKSMPEAVICAAAWYNAALNNLSDCMRLRNKFNDNRFLSIGTKELNKARAHLKREVNEWARQLGAVTYRPPAERYRPHFETEVAGIPCGVAVTHFERGTPHHLNGHPDDWCEGESSYVEYYLVDRKGYRAEWLERKDDGRLYEEVIEWCEESYHV